jgi:transcriptional regulator with XRE-family HTH domain
MNVQTAPSYIGDFGMDGAEVRARRLAFGWSQSRLARESGITHTTVQRVEAGMAANVTVDTLCRLARALNVAPTVLLRADCGAAA